MQNSNETVAEIREDVHEYLTSIGPSEYPDETQFEEFANRFVAAHRREIAELRECLRIIRDNLLAYAIKSDDGKYVNNGAFLSEEFVDDDRWRRALERTEDGKADEPRI